MAKRDLTTLEESFLEHLVSEECKGNVEKAKVLAGYAKSTSSWVLMNRLREEILERAETVLAAHAVQAAFGMAGNMEGTLEPDAKEHMAAMKDVMDRAGVIKKDGIKLGEATGGALFILPARKEEDGE